MSSTLTIAIPTYNREEVLMNTLAALLNQKSMFQELLILDQTEQHKPHIIEQLRKWHHDRMIRWMRIKRPSIPAAMNQALVMAESDIVLFLDDDIVPSEELLKGHLRAYLEDGDIWAVAGRVIQPWQSMASGHENEVGQGEAPIEFNFNSTQRQYVKEVMAGNLSVLRKKAIEVGGFDENFVGAAYRFETEFAIRLIRRGGKILFEPSASIRHLKVKDGGTRSFGDFDRSILPHHSVGAYYYILRSKNGAPVFKNCFQRFLKSIYTKHHLRRPWWIPITLTAEFIGLIWALMLTARGPRYIKA